MTVHQRRPRNGQFACTKQFVNLFNVWATHRPAHPPILLPTRLRTYPQTPIHHNTTSPARTCIAVIVNHFSQRAAYAQMANMANTPAPSTITPKITSRSHAFHRPIPCEPNSH